MSEERQSLAMQTEDWNALNLIALETESFYRGNPSFRRLMLRIARGDLVVKDAPHSVSGKYWDWYHEQQSRTPAGKRFRRVHWLKRSFFETFPPMAG